MASITLKGSPVETAGDLPQVGATAPSFTLTRTDLSDASLGDFAEKTVILNISPSVDTSICADSVRRFNTEATKMKDTAVLYISMDLPFALDRFCGAAGIENVIALSAFRSPEFAQQYGVTMKTGPLRGLLSRAIVIIDKSGRVIYTEQVPEIAQEPNYDAALRAVTL
jgi:thiol peroxidase